MKTLHVYEIRPAQDSATVTTRSFSGSSVFTCSLPQLAAKVSEELSKVNAIKLISAHTQEEADEEAARHGDYRLLVAITFEDCFELMQIEPESIDPINIGSAIDYARIEYRDKLDKSEIKAFESASKKIKKHLYKMLT